MRLRYTYLRGQMSIRVVIAEDHTLVREGTRRILEQSGDIQVMGEAADGEEAVQKVMELRPDVVLMDIAMPRLNGIEATRRIKALCPATAVLILTAYDDDPYIFALLEAGAAGYLMKSVRSDELVAAVRAVNAGESVLSPSVARKVLRRFGPSEGGGIGTEQGDILSEREKQVLLLAARGLPNKAIAKEMALSPRTVQLHLAHIFDKLGVASRTEAVVACLRRGWLRLEDIA